MQNSAWNLIHLLIHTNGNGFQNHVTHILFEKELWMTCLNACRRGQDKILACYKPIWYTPWFSQELWKYRQLRTVSGCSSRTFITPHFWSTTWAPKSQGTVILGFFPTFKYVVSLQQHSIPQTATGCTANPFTCDGNWWSYCRFCRFRCQHWKFQVNHACDQITK